MENTLLKQRSVGKKNQAPAAQIQIVQSGGRKRLVMKPGTQFSLDILNQVVKLFNEAIDEKIAQEEEDEEEEPVGPIIMQMKTNVSMVKNIFAQDGDSKKEQFETENDIVNEEIEEDEEDEDEDEEEDDIDEDEDDEVTDEDVEDFDKHKEESYPTNPSQRFGRRLLSIDEDDLSESEEVLSSLEIEDDSQPEGGGQDLADEHEVEADEQVKEFRSCQVNKEGCHDESENRSQQESLAETNLDKSDNEANEEENEEKDIEKEEEEEDVEEDEDDDESEDDFDLLDEESLSEILRDYDEPVMKIEVFMELIDALEEKLSIVNNEELHTSALQSLVVYILAADELATEDSFKPSSSLTKAASLLASLAQRLDQLKQKYLPQAVAFDHYVGEAWKVLTTRKHQFLSFTFGSVTCPLW